MKYKKFALFLVVFTCGCYQESSQETKEETPYVPCESVCQEDGYCFLTPECSCERNPTVPMFEDCSKNGVYATATECCLPTVETCKNSDRCRVSGECTYDYNDGFPICHVGSNMDCMLSEQCGPDLIGQCIFCPELKSCISCPTSYDMCQQYC